MMPHLFFWFGRNRLFFEQDLHKSNRVILLEYEKFVHNLANMMQWIYEFCDRRQAPTGEVVRLSATDPLNLVGILTDGPRIPAVRTRQVVYRDGVPVREEDLVEAGQAHAQ